MTLEEIKAAVESGKTVYWSNRNYMIIKDNLGRWLIRCVLNGSCIALVWSDNYTLNGTPEEFFVG